MCGARWKNRVAVAPTVASVPAGPRAHVRGVLVDETTNEPLPRFLLRVHDRTHQEDVWTDADGRFESHTDFGAGRLRIDPLDHPERRRPAPSLQVDHEVEGTSAHELAPVKCGAQPFESSATESDPAARQVPVQNTRPVTSS